MSIPTTVAIAIMIIQRNIHIIQTTAVMTLLSVMIPTGVMTPTGVMSIHTNITLADAITTNILIMHTKNTAASTVRPNYTVTTRSAVY